MSNYDIDIRRFTASQVATITGLSIETVQSWATRRLTPQLRTIARDKRGGGTARYFSLRDVCRFELMRILHQSSRVPLTVGRSICNRVFSHGDFNPEVAPFVLVERAFLLRGPVSGEVLTAHLRDWDEVRTRMQELGGVAMVIDTKEIYERVGKLAAALEWSNKHERQRLLESCPSEGVRADPEAATADANERDPGDRLHVQHSDKEIFLTGVAENPDDPHWKSRTCTARPYLAGELLLSNRFRLSTESEISIDREDMARRLEASKADQAANMRSTLLSLAPAKLDKTTVVTTRIQEARVHYPLVHSVPPRCTRQTAHVICEPVHHDLRFRRSPRGPDRSRKGTSI